MQRRNRRYYVQDELERLFTSFYRPARGVQEGEPYTCEELLRQLTLQNRSVMRQLSPTLLGRRLADMGLRAVHTRTGSVYRLVKL